MFEFRRFRVELLFEVDRLMILKTFFDDNRANVNGLVPLWTLKKVIESIRTLQSVWHFNRMQPVHCDYVNRTGKLCWGNYFSFCSSFLCSFLIIIAQRSITNNFVSARKQIAIRFETIQFQDIVWY